MTIERARRVLEVEAAAIAGLARSLDESFTRVIDMLAATRGRVILSGMGKSGIVCRKIAATLASTGTPALFVHPAEAVHGDLGMIVEGDTVLAVSNSGETEELVRLVSHIRRIGAGLIVIAGSANSTLARHADLALIVAIDQEGCPIGLAPMASTTATLALGDALAAALMDRKGFSPDDFARFHPGGKLGATLLQVADVMHKGADRPLVQQNATLAQALVEMSAKRVGITAVALDRGYGVISDGDIRRLLQRHGSRVLDETAGAVCTRTPKTIGVDRLAVEALRIMEQHRITALLALDASGGYAGVVHLHDLWKTKAL